MHTEEAGDNLPQFLVMGEVAFLVGIMRKVTQTDVIPVRVEMCEPPANPAFSEFCGVPMERGATNSIAFSDADTEWE